MNLRERLREIVRRGYCHAMCQLVCHCALYKNREKDNRLCVTAEHIILDILDEIIKELADKKIDISHMNDMCQIWGVKWSDIESLKGKE